jgi:hypothetical protein
MSKGAPRSSRCRREGEEVGGGRREEEIEEERIRLVLFCRLTLENIISLQMNPQMEYRSPVLATLLEKTIL